MKRILSCLLAFSCYTNAAQSSDQSPEHVLHNPSKAVTARDIEQSILDALPSHTPIPITRDCFGTQSITQGTTPFTIMNSGIYCLVDDVETGGTTLPIITINTNNVILDLNDHLIQAPGGGSGIAVSPNRSFIVIRNGNINNMRANGIQLSTGVSQVLIENMILTNINNGLLMFNNNNCIIQNCTSYFSRNAGFSITQCNNCIFTNCFANDNLNGFLLGGNTSMLFTQCSSQSNQLIGINQTLGSNSQFTQCNSSNNTTGFSISGNNNSYTQCQANQNTQAGFAITSINDSFQSCIAEENGTNGFQIISNAAILLNNQAVNNGLNGILLTSNNSIILNNIFLQNTNAGISLTALSTNNSVRNNSATANRIGFNNLGTNNHFYSNFANNNTTNYAGITNVAVSPLATDPINFTANIAE